MSKDYFRMLTLAGIDEAEARRLATLAEADDAALDNDTALEQERIIEKHIRMIARQVGIEFETSHAVIIDGKEAEVTLYEGSFALSHLLDFANKLAAQGVGSDVKVGSSSSNNVVLTFTLL